VAFARSIEIEDLFRMVESLDDARMILLRTGDLSEWRAHHSGDETYLSRLQCLVARYLWEESVASAPSSALTSFAGRLTTRDAIVTFNWDLILEQVLQSLSIPWSYTPQPGYLYVCKLHGSVNWLARQLAPTAQADWSLEAQDIGADISVVPLPVGGSYNFDPDVPNLSGAPLALGFVPAILAFGFRKEIGTKPFLKQWLWASDSLRAAYRVIITGYSLPQADLAARHLLNGALQLQRAFTGLGSEKHRIVVNLDRHALMRVGASCANDCTLIESDALVGLATLDLDGPDK
jgi:hypothetical protein